MDKNFYIELIYQSLSDELPKEQQKLLDEWLNASEENKKEATIIRKTWELSSGFSKTLNLDLDKDFAQLEQRISAERKELVGKKEEAIIRTMSTQRQRSWWKPLSVAAAVLFLAGAFFMFNNNKNTDAILALETSDEVRELVLADGSKVWLNENSKLSYPDKMDGAERRVTLIGEAFFDIAKNPNQPFVIETNETEVRVLGTSFQVSAYEDDKYTEVLVKTGKVSFGKKGDAKPMELEPNERGVFDKKQKRFYERTSRDFNEISWQSQILDFDNVPLKKILEDIEKHFDIELILDNSSLAKCRFTNTFNNPTQDETLEVICGVFQLQPVAISETSFRLKGGKCTTEIK